MVEDLGVEAKEAAVREVAKLLPLPELLQSISSIKADYIARQQVRRLPLNWIGLDSTDYQLSLRDAVFESLGSWVLIIMIFYFEFLRRMMHSLVPWLLSRWSFFLSDITFDSFFFFVV